MLDLLQTLIHTFKKRDQSSTDFNASSTAEEVLQSLDLTNKVIVITGVSSGLGAESARAFAARGAYVIGLCREPAPKDTYPPGLTIQCDLSDPKQIQAAVTTILQLHRKIDVILCNAGIMNLPTLQQIAGYEKQFFVNHIAHFILVTELLPALSKNGRVVVVSSEGHRLALRHGIEFDNLSGERNYNAWRAYGQSKLANLLFVKALARRFKTGKQIAIAVHPGIVSTRLGRHIPQWQRNFLSLFTFLVVKTVPEGAATQVFAAVHLKAAHMNGAYLSNCAIKKVSKKIADNLPLAEKLWETSMEIKQQLGF